MVDKTDKLDDKKLKAKEEAEAKENQNKKEDKTLSDEERRIAERAAEKKVSKDDAKKEIAREEVKRKTGYSAEAMAEVARVALKANASSDKDAGRAATDMARLNGNAVEGMLQEMVKPKVARDIVRAGLGSENLSTNEGGLEQGARDVLQKTKEMGGEKGMEKMLADAVMYGKGMDIDELKKLTPEKLKEVVDNLKNKNTQSVEPPRIPDNKKHKPSPTKMDRNQLNHYRGGVSK